MKRMYWLRAFLPLCAALDAQALADTGGLQQSMRTLAAESDGRIGMCALDGGSTEPVCLHGDQRFPLQSVMKLVVAATVMDAIDRRQMRLSDVVVVRPQDASPGPQEFANLVRSKGHYRATIEELLQRAVADSDSTSVDLLVERLGGVTAVQRFLERKQVDGIRIDRDERHLQAESVGLTWRAEYADSEKFEAAARGLPPDRPDAAWDACLKDPRDTATPAGMVAFLKTLALGQLLSAPSTQKLLAVMATTATGANRLKAGVPNGWRIGHKTGTGRVWRGMTSVTNDVGVLTAPDGGTVAVAVFVAESRRSDDERAAVIAETAKLVTRAYQRKR